MPPLLWLDLLSDKATVESSPVQQTIRPLSLFIQHYQSGLAAYNKHAFRLLLLTHGYCPLVHEFVVVQNSCQTIALPCSQVTSHISLEL